LIIRKDYSKIGKPSWDLAKNPSRYSDKRKIGIEGLFFVSRKNPLKMTLEKIHFLVL
jgi:hypothetical protein